ncbi:MAG: DNA polymerase Y family protein [Pseudomonadales bacterium]
MLWLCLHFPQLPLEIFTRHQPETDGKPCLLIDKNRVSHCNKQAIAAGINPGMSVNTANAVMDNLHSLPRSTDKEAKALEQLAHWAYRFTPAVSIESPCDLLLEVGSVLKLFQGLDSVLDEVKKELTELGYSVQTGLAHTPKAAWLMARARPNDHQAYFDDQRQTLNKQSLKQVLNEIPLALLHCPATQIEQMEQLGLSLIGELMDLPVDALGKRFGKGFLRYLAELRGEIADPRTFIRPQQHFEREIYFADAVDNSQQLLFPMHRMLEEFSQFLHSHQLECTNLSWRLHLHQGQQDIAINLSQPRHDESTFFQLTRTSLENQKLQGKVEGLSLHCDSFVRFEQKTAQLFESLEVSRSGKIHSLIDKLGTRLGNKTITSLLSRDEHLPEEASEPQPPATEQPGQLPLNFNAPRPAWLLKHPVSISQTQRGLYWHGKMTLTQGPERIESHWRKKPAERDYFVAKHENGAMYWVFHDRLNDNWFAQGVFS